MASYNTIMLAGFWRCTTVGFLARKMVTTRGLTSSRNGDIRAFFGVKPVAFNGNSVTKRPLGVMSNSSSSTTRDSVSNLHTVDAKRLKSSQALEQKENVDESNALASTTAPATTISSNNKTESESDHPDQPTQQANATTEAEPISPSTTTAPPPAPAPAPAVASTPSTPTTYGNFDERLDQLMDASWYDILKKEFSQQYFKQLVSFLHQEHGRKQKIFPPANDLFSALRDSQLSDLKVVILGQDPYHGPNQAHGLCFSVQKGIAIPPSLRNIYKEAHQDVGIKIPSHGCLSCWSQQGVLLLNNVLTVRPAQANSHKNRGWEQFTDAVIRCVNQNTSNVVFLLWGKPAQEKGAIINTSKHCVLKSSHPSPLGATKTNAPFIGSRCFSKANAYLKKHGKEPIDWNVL